MENLDTIENRRSIFEEGNYVIIQDIAIPYIVITSDANDETVITEE